MRIVVSAKLPSGNYFTVSQIAPIWHGDTLTIITGIGARHSWGYCQVTSSIVCRDADLVVIYLAWRHKPYGALYGGHAWRYYEHSGAIWVQKVYRCLSSSHKARIADLWRSGKAPDHAQAPIKSLA